MLNPISMGGYPNALTTTAMLLVSALASGELGALSGGL